MDLGGHGDPPFDYGCGDRSERQSARRGSSQLISICGKGSKGGNLSTRRPRRGSPLAPASCGCAQELACLMSAKEADTRTADSLTSDRKPSTQGELS
eukprot:4096449-Pleurochrysis_carterae.AAC.1